MLRVPLIAVSKDSGSCWSYICCQLLELLSTNSRYAPLAPTVCDLVKFVEIFLGSFFWTTTNVIAQLLFAAFHQATHSNSPILERLRPCQISQPRYFVLFCCFIIWQSDNPGTVSSAPGKFPFCSLWERQQVPCHCRNAEMLKCPLPA